MAQDVKHSIVKNLKYFENLSREEIYNHRKTKFLKIGRDGGFVQSANISDQGLRYQKSFISKAKRLFTKNQYAYYGLLAFLLTLIVLFAVV